MGANWYRVSIMMNNASNAFSGAPNATNAAMKTFTHEVGHALKLAHPTPNSSLAGHVYANGVPVAVMNQGYPNSTYIPLDPSGHDKNNLKAKWGN